MKVLVVGGGGREHALVWAIAQSEKCETLYCAPGNAGIEKYAQCVDISAEDVSKITEFAKDNSIDLVVVGPEAPLVAGLSDDLQKCGIAVFGPSKMAAQIEGSKGFMKDLCARYNIPTAPYGRFTDMEEAKAFIKRQGAPIVVKADGLAAGKGVIICETEEEAETAAKEMLSGDSFGDAGAEIVIEKFLDGEELSYFALADGKTMLPLTSAQDHKRAFDGDEGPNTGGMGAYSPAHLMTPELEEKILHRIIRPSIEGMAKDGYPFLGVLFAGIMVVGNEPYLLEYNVRFGDPECQAILSRFQGDFLEVLNACANQKLNSVKGRVTWSNDVSLCVVMAANGYPGKYEKNTPIRNLDEAEQAIHHVNIFHAGTAKGENGTYLSTGGRVLGVTALGENIGHAKRLAYEAVDQIDWPDGFCRRDIGWRAVEAYADAAE